MNTSGARLDLEKLRVSRSWRRGCFVAIFVVAAVLRFVNLRQSPGWYHDETIYVGEAWNLIHGSFQWDSVEHTFLPRLPFFHLLIAPFLLAFGKDVLCVRIVTAICGMLSVWLVYRLGREAGNRRAALFGAALFAICPYLVLLHRWGFSYDLDSVLGAANLYFLLRAARRPDQGRHLWLAAAMAGLGLTTDPIMISRLLLTVAVAFLIVPRRRAFGATAVTLAPLALYVAIMMLFWRGIFIEDVKIILFQRVSADGDWFSLARAFTAFLPHLGGYGVLGLAGLAFLPKRGPGRILLAAFILDLLVNVKLAAADASLFFRMGVVLAPTLFVGLGLLVAEIYRRALGSVRKEIKTAGTRIAKWRGRSAPTNADRWARFAQILLTVLVGSCALALLSYNAVSGSVGCFFPDIPKHYTKACLPHTSFEEAEDAAAWLQQRLEPDDLICTTHMEWMFDCRVASPMLVQLAEGGEPSGIYFEGLRDRFVYPCKLADVDYYISHPGIPYIAKVYDLDQTLRQIYDTWPKIHSEGSVSIYENPERISQ